MSKCDKVSVISRTGGTGDGTVRVAVELRAALAAAEGADASPSERAEMLMEIALGFQRRPRNPDQLHADAQRYDKALAICPADKRLLRASRRTKEPRCRRFVKI